MSMDAPLLLSAGTLALGLLLLLSLARSPWHWLAKAVLALSLTAAAIGSWYLLHAEAGKPARPPLPADFRLLHSLVIEPNTRHGQQGAIYIWVQDQSDGPHSPPRNYALPYSQTLHDKISAAQAANEPQRGRYQRRSDNRAGGETGQQGQIHFQAEPKRTLPAKPLSQN